MEVIRGRFPDARMLRDVTPEQVSSTGGRRRRRLWECIVRMGVARAQLEAARADLPDVLYRRAKHVVTECARVLIGALLPAAGRCVLLIVWRRFVWRRRRRGDVEGPEIRRVRGAHGCRARVACARLRELRASGVWGKVM